MDLAKEALGVALGLAVGLTIALCMGWKVVPVRPNLVPGRVAFLRSRPYLACRSLLHALVAPSDRGSPDASKARVRAAAACFFAGAAVFAAGVPVIALGLATASEFLRLLGLSVVAVGYVASVGALLSGEILYGIAYRSEGEPSPPPDDGGTPRHVEARTPREEPGFQGFGAEA